MDAKFRPIEKIIKKKDSHQSRLNFSEELSATLFLTTKRNEEILEEMKVEQAEDKLRRYKTN
jgi:hypothetical protein